MTEACQSTSTHDEPDKVLRSIVEILNGRTEPVVEGAGIYVSLTAGGLLLSGEVIPNWQWFREVAKLAGESSAFNVWADEAIKQRDLVDEALALNNAGSPLNDEHRAAVDIETEFIHLRGASVFMPHPIPATGHYWRGQLRHVSGWYFGGLAASDLA